MIDEKRIKECAKLLDISEQEAREMLEADEQIDKGALLFELTPEQKKAEKKYKNTSTKAVDAYGRKRTVNRKEDTDKKFLIDLLQNKIAPEVDKIEITGTGTIEFTYNNRKFKIVLSAPRK